MDEWNQLKEDVEELIKKKSTPDKVSADYDGLMSKESYSKLKGVDENATRDTVDTTLNNQSTNAVQNKAIYAPINSIDVEVSEIKEAAESFVNDVNNANTERGLRNILTRFRNAYNTLMTGVHRAADSNDWPSYYVFPSRNPNGSEFSCAAETNQVTMWYSGANRPLYWTNRTKTTYASSDAYRIAWSDFVIATSKNGWWYSYTEISGVGTTLTNLLSGLSSSNISTTKSSLKTQVSIVKKYTEFMKTFFSEFLIGHCNTSSCTPTNCLPFTEQKENIEYMLSVIKEVEVLLA